MTTARNIERRGFTLTELMIAVALLIVVIIASAKIFGIASQVTAQGQATADVLQEAAALERQLRQDLAALSEEGFVAIRSIRLRNDIDPSRLLDPNLPPGTFLRADQLVFFRAGLAGTQVFAAGEGSNRKQLGTAARIYYGHAIQVPNAAEGLISDPAFVFGNGSAVFPWSIDPVPGGSLTMRNPVTGAIVETANGTQPPARSWLLARQAVMLADDGASVDQYLSGGVNSVADIWQPELRNGRLDIAASQLNDIRNIVQYDASGNLRPWRDLGGDDQRSVIAQAVYYPRAERVAPTMDRLDHALTANVIAAGCSSFRVEWTYDATPDYGPTIWFGLPGDAGNTRPLVVWDADQNPYFTVGFDPLDVERKTITGGVEVYEALFGYDRALTPWPDALRITATLHDRNAKLENGRTFQFVIDLPRRASD